MNRRPETYDVISRGPGLLAQGGALATGGPARDFDVVVLAAQEYQPMRRTFPEGVRVVYAPIDDAELTQREAFTAEAASAIVARELLAGRRVLSTCMAGRNRSGLVTALALTKLYGLPGALAAGHVQASRPNALTNPSFVRYLSRIPPTPSLVR